MKFRESAIGFSQLAGLSIDQKGATMKGNLLMLSIVATVAALLLAPTFAGADVFMKEKLHTDGMTIMGHAQPPQDKISTTWVAQDKMRSDQGEISTIAKLEDGKMVIYHLNHPKKTYNQLSMGSDALQDVASGMGGEMKVKITPTGESKKIGNWNCQKYLQEMEMGMMPVASEIWASEDIKIPYKDFYEKSAMAMMPQQPGMKMSQQAMQEEMKKIKGVPVLTITSTTMMQNTTIRSSRELIEIKEDTAPGGIFDIPAGYTKQEMPQGMGKPRMPGKQKPAQ
jgi:hypothetical protein